MTAALSDDALELIRDLRATPERVFRAFTTPEELMVWWGKKGWPMTSARVDLRPGGQWMLEFRDPSSGELVSVFGQYAIVDPPRRLTMSWSASRYPGLVNLVEISFEPIASGTRLTLKHSRFAGNVAAFEDYSNGWVEVLGSLAAWVLAIAGVIAATSPHGGEVG
jgi:uncharacterized protein YndB with AHSA1/START domain